MTLHFFSKLFPSWFSYSSPAPEPSSLDHAPPSIYVRPDGTPRDDYEGHALACAAPDPAPPYLEFDAELADSEDSPFRPEESDAALSDDDVWARRDPADDKGVEYE